MGFTLKPGRTEQIMKRENSGAARIEVKALLVGGLLGWGAWASAQQVLGPPPPELRYMSPKCASMSEAIRTAAPEIRRLPSHQELRQRFNLECGQEQSEARRRLHQEQSKAREEEARADYEARKRQLEQENAARTQTAQCQEMFQALEARRKRPNLTEGEQRDLQMFEGRYRQRCL